MTWRGKCRGRLCVGGEIDERHDVQTARSLQISVMVLLLFRHPRNRDSMSLGRLLQSRILSCSSSILFLLFFFVWRQRRLVC